MAKLWTLRAARSAGFRAFADSHSGEKTLIERLVSVYLTHTLKSALDSPEGEAAPGGERMAKWPNWRRKPTQYICPACHGTEWVLQTRRAWQIPRCERCGLLMLAVGRLRGWRDYRRRVEAPLRVR